MSKKELYFVPETEVLELRLEGVIAASGSIQAIGDENEEVLSW